MRSVSALLSGLVFGIGLGLSGLMNPQKVKNFLDVTGTWDGSLMFVMGGGILVGLMGYRLSRKMKKPIYEPEFCIPQKTKIDIRLLAGSATFGVGWGLGGICPGPGFANLLVGTTDIIAFVVAMVAGLVTTNFFVKTN